MHFPRQHFYASPLITCTSHDPHICWLLSLSLGKMNLKIIITKKKYFWQISGYSKQHLEYLSPSPISVNEIKGIQRRRDKCGIFAHVSPEAIHVRKIIVIYLHSVGELSSNLLINVCARRCLLSKWSGLPYALLWLSHCLLSESYACNRILYLCIKFKCKTS